MFESGAAALTLDAVAARAGLSKGGLLHHFPSKDRLIEGMAARITVKWRADVLQAIAASPPGVGRAVRAVVGMCCGRPELWDENMRRTSVVLVASMVASPAAVVPMREVYAELRALIRRDGLAPERAEVVLAALDGMWFRRIFGLVDQTDAERLAILRVLDSLASDDAPAAAAPAAAGQSGFPASISPGGPVGGPAAPSSKDPA